MSPEVTAAVIAASVSVLTLIGTLVAQYFGRRATSRDTQEALEEQRKQLNRTLAEQRTRTLNERFATAAEQLGSDKPAIRLAGVYAMAGLADDWDENRQTCVDVLCAYLRMPYEPDPGPGVAEPERLAFQAIREARHTVIRVATAHLKSDAAVSWQGLNFDFTGVVFDGGDFRDAQFSGGAVSFGGAHFSGGAISFGGAKFSGARVNFDGAQFSGGSASFRNAQFSAGTVSFNNAQFSGSSVSFSGAQFSQRRRSARTPGAAPYMSTVSFDDAEFSAGMVSFSGARISHSTVGFSGAQFSGGMVSFGNAHFSGGTVYFGHARLSRGTVDFSGARFSGGTVSFSGTEFFAGAVSFGNAQFSAGMVYFTGARFSGATVNFMKAQFSGGTVDFSGTKDWSFPPAFSWTDTPPRGVKLPKLA